MTLKEWLRIRRLRRSSWGGFHIEREELLELQRRRWYEGRDAVAILIEELSGSDGMAGRLLNLIRALKSPYEKSDK